MWWPKLDQQLSEITEPNIEPENKRSSDSMLEEVLGLVRQMSRSLSNTHSNELKIFNSLLQTLTPKEERILSVLYGLNLYFVHTYNEVGDILGIDILDVMHIENQAIDKLKHRYPEFFKALEPF